MAIGSLRRRRTVFCPYCFADLDLKALGYQCAGRPAHWYPRAFRSRSAKQYGQNTVRLRRRDPMAMGQPLSSWVGEIGRATCREREERRELTGTVATTEVQR